MRVIMTKTTYRGMIGGGEWQGDCGHIGLARGPVTVTHAAGVRSLLRSVVRYNILRKPTDYIYIFVSSSFINQNVSVPYKLYL